MKKCINICVTLLPILFCSGAVFSQSNVHVVGTQSQAPHFDKEKALQDARNKGIPENQIFRYLKTEEFEFNHRNHIPNPAPTPLEEKDVLHTVIYKNENNQVYRITSNGGGNPSPQNQYCPNAGFEMYNFSNWTGSYGAVSSGSVGANFPVYTQTSPTILNPAGNNVGLTNMANYQTIMTTPATNAIYPNCVGYDSIACRVIGTQTVSQIPVVNPTGGSGVSVRMNGAVTGYRAAKLSYVMALNPNNKRFSISYAIVLEQAGHQPQDQPYFSVSVKDQNGNLVPGCSIYTVTVGPNTLTQDTLFKQSAVSYDALFRPWQTYNFDFTNNPSVTSVTVEFYVGDCAQGGHYGYAYIDAQCGLGGVVANYCAGSNSALLSAPGGYSTYQWVGPSGNVPVGQGGTAANATVTPVLAGQVFTCNVTSSGGCVAAFQTTIAVTTVSVPNINSTPSCGQGASGSATAYPIGSNQGYLYSWVNSSGATVGNAQTATNLAPGVYTVNVTSPGCGAASGTVAVGISPPFFTAMNAPFCGSVAWISAASGSNYQWYNGSGSTATPISTSSSITINNPVVGGIYSVTYNNAQGCRDSVNYTLTQIPGGYIYASGINGTCPGTSIGTAAIHLSTSQPAPYSYTITGVGGYNSTLPNTTQLRDSISGLAAGGYTATVTDGVCQYISTFTISPIIVSFTATPTSTMICAGNSAQLGLQFAGSNPTSCGISSSGCSSPSQAQVGFGTAVNSNFSYPAPYGNYFTNARHQFLFLASELQAAGIGAGKISSLSFMVNTINGLTSYPNYNISLKCTSLNALPTTNQFETGLSMVYNVPAYTVVNGWNTHNFQSAYDWDGTSNLIVEICYSTNPFVPNSWTSNSNSPYTITSFISSKVFYSDQTSACGPPVPASFSWMTSTSRPNVKFGYCAGSINPSSLTYSWSPSSFLSSPTIMNPVATPPSNITYSVNAYLTGATSCSATSTSTINVTIPVTPTISPAGPVCNTTPAFNLSVTPTGGTWSVTATTSTLGVFTPSVASIGTNTVSYTYGAIGCLRTSSTTVSVEKFVPSTITGSISPLCVSNNTVNLMTLPQYTTGVWSGTGVIGGNVFNPTTAGAGTFVLTYSTTSAPIASLCPSTSTLAVSVSSVPQPTVTPIGPFCDNFATQNMIVMPAGGTWAGMGVTSGGVFTPSLAAVGSNTLVYTLVNGPCTATASTAVSVEKFVAATLTGSAGPFCIYDPMMNLQPLAVNSGGTWSGPGVTGTNFTPSVAGAGTFTVQYHTQSATTPSLCPDNAYMSILVNPKPQVNALSDKQSGCNYPFNVAFYTSSVNTGTGRWDFGNGTQANGLSVSNSYSVPGTYQATFYYTDNVGCKDTALVAYLITNFAVPEARFEASPQITTIVASEVHFTNHTTNLNNNTYSWSFGDGSTSTDMSPVYMYPETGQYMATLIATSPEGCQDSLSAQITINPDVVLYVPNAFTPGNHDGLNDVFYISLPPTGVDFSTVTIQVFDRWGEMIFQTRDVNTGWKGSKNNSGELLKQDVYVWKVTFMDNNKKYYEKLGQVTLLK